MPPLPPDERRCTGHNRDGSRCRRWVQNHTYRKGKCYRHGGRTLSGTSHPNFRNGKYSQDLPTRYAADYQQAIADPEIHALTHEIGIIEARYRDLLRRSDSSDLGHAWLAVMNHWRAYLEAKQEEKCKAQDLLEHTLRRGMQDYLLWQNIQETTKILSTLRYQEHKRLIDLQAVMTEHQMEQALGLIELALHDAVMAHVDAPLGRSILADAQTRVRRFLPQRTQS